MAGAVGRMQSPADVLQRNAVCRERIRFEINIAERKRSPLRCGYQPIALAIDARSTHRAPRVIPDDKRRFGHRLSHSPLVAPRSIGWCQAEATFGSVDRIEHWMDDHHEPRARTLSRSTPSSRIPSLAMIRREAWFSIRHCA